MPEPTREITAERDALRAEVERAEDESAKLRRQIIDERVQATRTSQELFAKWRGERDQARGERDALSSLLRGMARRVGQMRREIRLNEMFGDREHAKRGVDLEAAQHAAASWERAAHGNQEYAVVLHAELLQARAEIEEIRELAAALPCGWCKGTGIAPEERFGRDGDGAPMVDGDQPCPEGCRPSVSDQTPDDGDPFEIRSHAYRRANVCYECGQNPAAHASGQTPATPDEPRRNALVSVDMGALIRAERAPSSVQGDTTPIRLITAKHPRQPGRDTVPLHDCDNDPKCCDEPATSAPSEGDHHA